ncbi:hypothetical protein PFISCL1PPCAC_3257, partial [Pristionchus fissidentatus]
LILLSCSVFDAAVVATAGNPCGEWKKVESGSTCYSIRTANSLSEAQFSLLNTTINCDALQVGQKLCVAGAEKLYCEDHVSVSAGDSCWLIRTAHGMDERQFMEMNEGLECDQLSIGQKLCIRASPEQPASTTAPVESSPAPPVFSCPETVSIQSGDTCYSLSQRYGLNETEFDEINADINCDSLEVGTSICVSREGCHLRYETRSGDSCHRIAVAFKISLDELRAANEGVDCDRLEVGRRLCVWRTSPAAVSKLSCAANIRVKEGDTCWSVSVAHGVSVDEIRMLNPSVDCDRLQIDVEICVKAEEMQ